MFSWSINLFRIRGIQLAVHSSFLLLLAYMGYEGWKESSWLGLAWSMVMLVACFTCVVLHELGHSFTAQHYGIGVPRILLLPIGGMAQFDRIPRLPRQELLITAAGPAVNFVIAGILWFAVDFPPGWLNHLDDYSVAGFLTVLFAWNIAMGCFNLLPAFPMDGGRIFRALLAIRLDYLRATWWAATVGKVVCVVGVAASLYFELAMSVALFAFIAVIGELEYRSVKRRAEQDAAWQQRMLPVYVPLGPPDEPPVLGR